MGSEFERLEKAESELLESIRAKESERDALKKQFEELRAEINLILNDTRNELGDKIQAISGFDRPFRQTSRGVELPSWSVNDYDDDEYDTSRIMNDLKAISGQIKQKFDSLNQLADSLEKRIAKTRLEQKLGLLNQKRIILIKASEELSGLQIKYSHYFAKHD